MKKEHPILFSTPMVQAILEGRKTQTRRVIKPQPKPELSYFGWEVPNYTHVAFGNNFKIESKHKNRYGQPGDLLWVRENWASSKALDKVKPSNILSGFPCEYQAGGTSLMNYNELIDRGRWRPSIHMPKHAARIWLKVKDVRVERVQDISEEDILKEGVRIPVNRETGNVVVRLGVDNSALSFLPEKSINTKYTQSQLLFAHWAELWCKVNGRQSWDANPWVWVITFEELSRTGRPEPETCNLEPETFQKEISNNE